MAKSLVKLKHPVHIISAGSVVGSKEKSGPLGDYFDISCEDNRFGMETWELAESEMVRLSLNTALSRLKMDADAIDAIFAGDLLNQCVGSSYGLYEYGRPVYGLYGACSTSAEGLSLSSMLIAAGHFDRCATVVSSHFCSAERQYRTPIEYGGQRTPTAQWTVTGSGGFILSGIEKDGPKIIETMPGIPIDKGICDASNMGAAMAPAAADTIIRYLKESGHSEKDFDLIMTGDLGHEGSAILCDLLLAEGIDITKNHNDSGKMIFDKKTQDTHSGGSGCGCGSVVLASYILPKVKSGELKNILYIATGALMNPASLLQGKTSIGIAHLVRIVT